MVASNEFITILSNIASRYAPSRVLSYNIAHVVIAIQLMGKYGIASRALLCKDLALGEGSIRTLVKHMRMHGIVTTGRRGTILTNNGKDLYEYIIEAMPREASIPYCSIAIGKANYAVRVSSKYIRKGIGKGIEQRDAAVKVGAIGATTLIYRDAKFIMPDAYYDALQNEYEVRALLLNRLVPYDGDVIVIGSADDIKVAEVAAKYAILLTIL